MDKVFSIYVSSDDIMIDCEDQGKWTVKRFKTKKDAENCLKKYFN